MTNPSFACCIALALVLGCGVSKPSGASDATDAVAPLDSAPDMASDEQAEPPAEPPADVEPDRGEVAGSCAPFPSIGCFKVSCQSGQTAAICENGQWACPSGYVATEFCLPDGGPG